MGLAAARLEAGFKRPAIVFLVMAVTFGCASVRPVDSDGAFLLAPDEGLLVVDIHSTLPIAELSFSRATAASDLPPGDHFFLLAVTTGNYRWSQIVVPADEGDVPFVMTRDDVWSFRVEPGRISYPGHIAIDGRTGKRNVSIAVFPEDRSGLALRQLRERFPKLLARYPPVYTGPRHDDFLDYFARMSSSSETDDAQDAPP